MFSLKSKGSFKNLDSFLTKASKGDFYKSLEKFAKQGVDALSKSTPVDSSETAQSWDYEIHITGRAVTIAWTNSHADGGAPVAILLQYGHGTGTGGYVEGRDFINPAMKPIFDKIADDVWKAVTSA